MIANESKNSAKKLADVLLFIKCQPCNSLERRSTNPQDWIPVTIHKRGIFCRLLNTILGIVPPRFTLLRLMEAVGEFIYNAVNTGDREVFQFSRRFQSQPVQQLEQAAIADIGKL